MWVLWTTLINTPCWPLLKSLLVHLNRQACFKKGFISFYWQDNLCPSANHFFRYKILQNPATLDTVTLSKLVSLLCWSIFRYQTWWRLLTSDLYGFCSYPLSLNYLFVYDIVNNTPDNNNVCIITSWTHLFKSRG